MRARGAFAALGLLTACASGGAGKGGAPAAPPVASAAEAANATIPLLADVSLPALSDPPDPDGVDDGGPFTLDPLDTTRGALVFEAAPAPPATAHPRVCDLRGLAGALFVSHAEHPIDEDGARIHRYDPKTRTWTLAFDWDRGSAPGDTTGLGGQGLTRLRLEDGHLVATDSDAPMLGGFHFTMAGFEGYLFVSDEKGVFAPLGADAAPPADAKVIPFAFHVFDVIHFRGALVASGGTASLTRESNARAGRYPGAIYAGRPGGSTLLPRFALGSAGAGVQRVTYLARFAGRLYMGFQNNERRARYDLAVLSGDPDDVHTAPPVLARVTADGGWLTRRFAAGDGTLYWIASGYGGRDARPATVFASRDGRHFVPVALPADAGEPQDLVVVGTTRWLLTTHGLYRAEDANDRFARVADAPAGDPFGAFDTFCSAPLTVLAGRLWAGSTRDGGVYSIRAR
jgi:hypothetical protein